MCAFLYAPCGMEPGWSVAPVLTLLVALGKRLDLLNRANDLLLIANRKKV